MTGRKRRMQWMLLGRPWKRRRRFLGSRRPQRTRSDTRFSTGPWSVTRRFDHCLLTCAEEMSKCWSPLTFLLPRVEVEGSAMDALVSQWLSLCCFQLNLVEVVLLFDERDLTSLQCCLNVFISVFVTYSCIFS